MQFAQHDKMITSLIVKLLDSIASLAILSCLKQIVGRYQNHSRAISRVPTRNLDFDRPKAVAHKNRVTFMDHVADFLFLLLL